MADQKISELTEVVTPLTTDMLAVTNAGATKKVSIANVLALAGSAEWTFEIIKSVNQDITANTTLQNDTELFRAVTAFDVWHFELYAVISGNAFATDFKLQATFPNGIGISRAYHWTATVNTFSEDNNIINNAALLTQIDSTTWNNIDIYRKLRPL